MLIHLQLLEAPTVEPLGLLEVKLDRGIEPDDTEDDARLELLIASAREQCEAFTRRALLRQKWKLIAQPVNGRVRLPRWPVLEVLSVTHKGEPVEHTDLLGDGAAVLTDALGQVEVIYVAGYGDDPADVPARLRNWMMLMIGSANEYREEAVSGTIVSSHAFVNRMIENMQVPLGG